MPLSFADVQPFASGGVGYSSRPATEHETVSRLFLQITIEGEMTEAAVDTGGVFLICNAHLANRLQVDESASLQEQTFNIRGTSVTGNLHRLNLGLFAEEGNGIQVEVTAFIPRDTRTERWEQLPCFLGWQGCLERLRFAVDPETEMFYFGGIA